MLKNHLKIFLKTLGHDLLIHVKNLIYFYFGKFNIVVNFYLWEIFFLSEYLDGVILDLFFELNPGYHLMYSEFSYIGVSRILILNKLFVKISYLVKKYLLYIISSSQIVVYTYINIFKVLFFDFLNV